MHKLKPWQQIAYQVGLLVLALFVLLPVWGLSYMALDGGIKGWPTTFRLWPRAVHADRIPRYVAAPGPK